MLPSSILGLLHTQTDKLRLQGASRCWGNAVRVSSMWLELNCRRLPRCSAKEFLAKMEDRRFSQLVSLALPSVAVARGTFTKLKELAPQILALDVSCATNMYHNVDVLLDQFALLQHLRL